MVLETFDFENLKYEDVEGIKKLDPPRICGRIRAAKVGCDSRVILKDVLNHVANYA